MIPKAFRYDSQLFVSSGSSVARIASIPYYCFEEKQIVINLRIALSTEVIKVPLPLFYEHWQVSVGQVLPLVFQQPILL